MTKLIPADPAGCSFDLNRDLSISTRERKPGSPERIDGFTLGIVSMAGESPHGGEVHPDGDEFLYVISGRLRVAGDTSGPLEIGPNGDHRPKNQTASQQNRKAS